MINGEQFFYQNDLHLILMIFFCQKCPILHFQENPPGWFRVVSDDFGGNMAYKFMLTSHTSGLEESNYTMQHGKGRHGYRCS